MRKYAESKFKRDGVRVQGNSKITAVGPDWLELEGEGRGEWIGLNFDPKLIVSTLWSVGLVNGFIP